MASIFRIGESSQLVAQGAETDNSPAAYLGRLVRLIPAEVLAVYQTLYGVLKEPESPAITWLPVIGVVLVFLVRVWGTRDASNKFTTAQWLAVVISMVSFIIWVLASGHKILWFGVLDPRLCSALMILWVFVVPIFYKGDKT